jgi:hypothetical protein
MNFNAQDFFYDFNFDIKLKINLNELQLSDNWSAIKHVKDVTKLFDDITLNFFESKCLSVTHSNIFYLPPNAVSLLHTDGDLKNSFPYGALNFVLGNYIDWSMNWYDYPKNANYKPVYKKYGVNGVENTTNITSTILDVEEATLITSHTFVNPCLVRVDIPHKVINFGKLPRYAVTIRFTDTDYYGILKKLLN